MFCYRAGIYYLQSSLFSICLLSCGSVAVLLTGLWITLHVPWFTDEVAVVRAAMYA